MTDGFPVVLHGFENFRVGPPTNHGSLTRGLTHLGYGGDGLAALVLLAIKLAFAMNLGDHALAERVHDRRTYTVQTTRDLIGTAFGAELSTTVEGSHNDL